MTTLCSGEKEAWHELERMLYVWAKSVESGRPMTQEERLKIFAGPKGEFRKLLMEIEKFKEIHDAREAKQVKGAINAEMAKQARKDVLAGAGGKEGA